MTRVRRRAAAAPALALWLTGCTPPSQARPPEPQPTAATAPSAAATAPVTAATAPVTTASAPARITTSGTEPVAAAALPAAAAPTFVVRYACDDKYAAEAECRPGKAAWNAWLAGLALTSGAASLLDHQGGGPSGAEWNPVAPLVAFVAGTEPGRARLKLSLKRTLTPGARLADHDVFFVPFAAWNGASRPARSGDLSEPAQMDAIRVVELRAWGPGGELARGIFAFSGGE